MRKFVVTAHKPHGFCFGTGVVRREMRMRFSDALREYADMLDNPDLADCPKVITQVWSGDSLDEVREMVIDWE